MRNSYFFSLSLHLRELQGLVSEGRGVIAHQVQRNQQLLSANAATLTRNLEDLEAQAKVSYLPIRRVLVLSLFFLAVVRPAECV